MRKYGIENFFIEEVEQLQNLLTGVRNISRIDAGQDLEESKELPVNLYISNIAKHFNYSEKHLRTILKA